MSDTSSVSIEIIPDFLPERGQEPPLSASPSSDPRACEVTLDAEEGSASDAYPSSDIQVFSDAHKSSDIQAFSDANPSYVGAGSYTRAASDVPAASLDLPVSSLLEMSLGNQTSSFERGASGSHLQRRDTVEGVASRQTSISGQVAPASTREDEARSHAPSGATSGGRLLSGIDGEGEEVHLEMPGSTRDLSATGSDEIGMAGEAFDAPISVSWGPVDELERPATRWEPQLPAASRVTNGSRSSRRQTGPAAFEVDRTASPLKPQAGDSTRYTVSFSRRMVSGELAEYGRRQKSRPPRSSLPLHFALTFRLVCAVALLGVGLFTFSRVRDSVACNEAICYKGENVFSVGEGYAWADDMLVALEWQLLLPLLVLVLTISVNCYMTFAAIQSGSKKSLAREEKATIICCLISTCCLAVLVAPVFLVLQGFCNFNSYDWTYLYAEPTVAAVRAGKSLCDQKGLILMTVGVAAAAVCSELSLLFRGYTRFFEATLILGYLKFAAGATVLSMATLVARDSSQYADLVREIRNVLLRRALEEQMGQPTRGGLFNPAADVSRQTAVDSIIRTVNILPVAVASQYSLFFDTTLSALYIMGFVNVGCGLYGCLAAWSRSHVLATVNTLVNFVFVVVNAVGVGGMLFGAHQLKFSCNYSEYPVRQLDYDIYLSRLVCQSNAAFLTSWGVLAIAVFIFFVDFVVSAWGFIQNFCRKEPVRSSQKSPVDEKTD
ncbi:hypothetical protein TGME49_213950 [Toxoplasma gondii ME49]|uniref:Transmembrane protein n=1 Tax=Toxoplasma gondii (strain ATCC 50611 / Me49) TaxID=508771 RepID=S8GRT2_TOXGM|nr:hypothetical protein TGME49_213950 [Toxoplasma gondii ME49]EPT31279.1 hypothetical protein TGME49_213950 [Toxoplasma gondii ME49]|eukprot:XP_018637914.1 hypothetical protein TGME49_213950 [Toxoplasma gondii ME49]